MGLKTTTKTYNTFSTGIVTDTPHTEIPDTACAYATNAIFYKDGNVANRGGVYRKWVSSITGPRNNGKYVSIGSYKTNKATSSDMLCAVSYKAGRTGGNKIVFEPWDANTAAGTYSTTTNLDSSSSTVETSVTGPPIGLVAGLNCGKTFNYFGDMGVPVGGASINSLDPAFYQGQNGVAFFAGNPGTAEYSHYVSAMAGTLTVTVAAGNSAITFGSVPTFTPALPADPVGKYIYVTDGTNEYIGKIIKQTSTTVFNVSPTPTKSFIAASPLAGNAMVRVSNIATIQGWNVEAGGGAIPAVAASGCVHQNRVVLAGAEPVPYAAADLQAISRVDVGSMFYSNMRTQNFANTTIKPMNTICWSAIRAEPSTAVNGNLDGDIPLLRGGWPKSQYVTLDTQGITAIVPIDVNNLLVLCVDKVLMLSGTLGTILPNAFNQSNSDFNIRVLSTTYSCTNDATVQVTPYGIFFADKKGIYLTDGYKFVDTLKNKVLNAFAVLNNNTSPSIDKIGAAEPTGSAYVNGHYILFYPPLDYDDNSVASVCVNAELNFAVSYFTFQAESDTGAAYPSLGYTTTVNSNNSIVGIVNNTMTNTYDCIVNFDRICTSTATVFDCWSYLDNFETLIIPKSVVLSESGGLSRLKKIVFNYQTYVTGGSQAPGDLNAVRNLSVEKGIIDNVSFAIASVTVASVSPAATTTGAGSGYDTILQRTDLVAGSLPDSTSTTTNSNIGYSFYPYFVTSGTVFILNSITYVFNSLTTGRVSR